MHPIIEVVFLWFIVKALSISESPFQIEFLSGPLKKGQPVGELSGMSIPIRSGSFSSQCVKPELWNVFSSEFRGSDNYHKRMDFFGDAADDGNLMVAASTRNPPGTLKRRGDSRQMGACKIFQGCHFI